MYLALSLILIFSPIIQLQETDTSFTPPDSLVLEAFMDGMIESKLLDKNITGASVSVVHDGEFLLKKGYGYSDFANRVPVSPDSTLFRIGSVSKIFTWMAVMQHVEQGEINLDADINEYLEPFQVQNRYRDPVTMRSLLSHTPGFEDRLLQLFVREPADMIPLEQTLREQMPQRVRPPLQHASYSNHGTGLAEYIIEQLSGQSFEEYAAEHFFNPLQMQFSTFRQPLPDWLSDQLSNGYAMEDGRLVEKDFEYVPMPGVGGASSTASDMGNLMIALLDESCFDEHCLMQAETFETMKEPVLYHADGVNPALHGFMDMSMNGVRIVGHGGDTFWFHTLMAIYPHHDLGLFITFNSEGGAGTYIDALVQFTNRFFPDTRPLADTIELEEGYLQRFAGQYKVNRHPRSDITKLISIMNTAEVSVRDDKLRLDLPGIYGQDVTHWVPIDSTRFRAENNNQIIVFDQNDSGRVEHLYLGILPIIAFEKLGGFWSPSLHLGIFLLTVFISLYMLLYWPWLYIVRRNYDHKEKDHPRLPFLTKLTGFATSLCMILFYLLMSIGLSVGQEIVFEIPPIIGVSLIFPFLVIFFLLGMIQQSWQLWNWKLGGFFSRLFYYASILIFVAAIWQLWFWNMLGWHY